MEFGLSSIINAVKNAISSIGSAFQGLFTGEGSIGQSLTNPSQWWDYFKNGRTNDVNQDIASQNLAYQRERNEIDDARYLEERDYNRAFAEDERAYNRALQERLFEREDTAQIRQAQQLSSMGINPLSQQLNGAGAGQVVGSASAPVDSSRGGSALHNDFQMQDMGVMQALAPLASLANTINQVATGQGQRDLLRTQIDRQNLDNYIIAKENGLMPYFMKDYKKFADTDIGHGLFDRKNTRNLLENNLLTLDWQNKYKPEFARNLDYLLSDSFEETATKALTKGSKLFDKALESSDNKLKDYNPFRKFMELFW